MTFSIERERPLAELNSLRLPAVAAHYVRAETVDEVAEGCEYARGRKLPLHLLGGGTNVILSSSLPGLVLQPALGGIRWPAVASADGGSVAAADGEGAELCVGAGEPWPELVEKSMERKLYGLENLALIPGWAGAAPIQNIGAYGRDFSDVCLGVNVYDPDQRSIYSLSAADCLFDYRESLFKREEGRHLIVCALRMQLSAVGRPHLGHKSLAGYFAARTEPSSPEAVFDAVCRLRRAVLLDPEEFANVGSFFKNPTVAEGDLRRLRQLDADLPAWLVEDGWKIPAARLIEQCGWKGRREGGVGLAPTHAQVLVNYGATDAEEIMGFAGRLRAEVESRFALRLEIEPVFMQATA